MNLIKTKINLEEYTQTDILMKGLIEYDQELNMSLRQPSISDSQKKRFY
jgi:hypothetical protein